MVKGVLKGVGTGLAVQAAASPISAYLSSYWEEKVHEINNDIEYASKGELPHLLNVCNIKKSSDQSFINKENQSALYDQFYRQKRSLIL